MENNSINIKNEVIGKYSKRVADLISYFTLTLNYLSQIRLIKLIYLSELYNIGYYRNRISDADFYKWYYGPWSPDIEHTAMVITGNKIKLEESETKEGHACIFIKPNVERMKLNFTEKEFFILETVVKDWKYIPTKTLIAFTKNSDLFDKTKKWKQIDLNKYLQNSNMSEIDKIPIGKIFSLQILGYRTNFLKEKDGYSITIPKLDGCYTQGDTFEEAFNNVRDAIISYLNAMINEEIDSAG
jgi:predicted RNase H-like HicB family nuclease